MDSLAEWLHLRYGDGVWLWSELKSEARQYWECEAQAVRRAVQHEVARKIPHRLAWPTAAEEDAVSIYDNQEIVELLQKSNKISAIRTARQIMGWGLRESKDACEILQDWLSRGYDPRIPEPVSEKDEQAAIESIRKVVQ